MVKRCESRKKNGKRCEASAQSGKNVCVFHDPAKAADGFRARRAGGLARTSGMRALPPDTPEKTRQRKMLGESINQVRRGELDPKLATTVGYLAGHLLRALEQFTIEERVAKIESALGLQDS